MTAEHPEQAPEAIPSMGMEHANSDTGAASSNGAASSGISPTQESADGTPPASVVQPELPSERRTEEAITESASERVEAAAPAAEGQSDGSERSSPQADGVPDPTTPDTVPAAAPSGVHVHPRRSLSERIAAMVAATRETARRVWKGQQTFPASFYVLAYALTFVLAIAAFYVVINAAVVHVNVALDDMTYGRPRTTHLDTFVGHDETAGLPTHLIAMNLNRQVVIIELPGGDPAKVRTIAGPYLFGADEHLTPVTMSIRDMDGDGSPDLLLDIRREQLVYLNKDGTFRLPTPEEQVLLHQRSGP